MNQQATPEEIVNEGCPQIEACERMAGDSLDLMLAFGGDFRRIITEFKKQGRIPTANDLIWLESEKHECDLTRESTDKNAEHIIRAGVG